ncbi:MAG TPA: ABC transporter permease [Firmicutes bacterium]|jgi:putative ABC transport system permease protein|nr:ABC transporter permease [Bacillota bacterium]HOQ23409.1 ABC transporter permease [Bacillota bacterium]HPT66827.1 ABC transporter permease [Bacillota bacterium]
MGVWFGLAIKNLLRRPTRSILTILGVTIAIAVLYSLLQFQVNYEKGLKKELGALGAHVMVVPKGCPYEAATIVLHGGKWPRYMDEAVLEKVKSVPGIAQTAGIIMDAILDFEKNENRIFMGIDEDYPKIRGNWHVQGSWFTGAKDEIILGENVAKLEGLKVGDTYYLKEKDCSFKVIGILAATHSQDDGFYFLHRKTLQKVFDLPEKLVVILVKLADIEQADKVVAKIRTMDGNLNVFPLSELLSTVGNLVQSTNIFVLAIVFIAIAISAVGVLNTILMAVYERTKEIGMMKAVGASRSDIFKLIWLETLVVCTTGGLFGVGLALAFAKVIESFVRSALPYASRSEALIGLSLSDSLACVLFSVVLGLIAGWYPACHAASVKPMEAIRTE